MNKIILWSCVIGFIFIISSFISFKTNKRKNNYTSDNYSKLKNKISSMRLVNIFADLFNSKNTFKKLKLITQCKISKNVHESSYKNNINSKNIIQNKISDDMIKCKLKKITLYKIAAFVIAICLSLGLKLYLNNVLIKQTLNPTTIYETTKYRISTENATLFNNAIGNSYKDYFKAGKTQEFLARLSQINKTSVRLEDTDIRVLANVYLTAYKQSVLTPGDYSLVLILGLLGSFLITASINVQYRIYKLRLLEEFHNLELISLLQMNRSGINVYEILSEINKYAVYLKPYLTICLNTYNSNPVKSLDTLIKQVDNDSFSKFVGILKSCLSKPKDINYEVLQLQRKLRVTNDRLDIDKKMEFKKVALTVAQFPLILLFSLTLIIPMVSQINFATIG